MIKLNRLNGQELVINAELVERIEAKPDTIITLISGERFIVSNSVDEVIRKITDYKKTINQSPS